MANLSVALASARTYLNDDAGSLHTDASLIPKIQEAHRELQTMLWEVGSPAVRRQSNGILVAANATNLGEDLPDDLLTPFKLQEYAEAGTYADAVDMTEVIYIPNRAPQATLIHWAWKEEMIVFVGASANRNVVIHYRRLIPIPAAANDPIGIIFGELYLGARAAAIVHGSLGNKDAYTIASDMAKENFQRVVAAQRGQQTPAVRP